MEVDGPISYKVTITAEDKPKDGTNSPIFFTIIGGKGKGQKKLFSEKGLEASKTDSLTFNSNDIGDISGFALEIEENGRFKPKEIVIENLSKFFVIGNSCWPEEIIQIRQFYYI